MAAVGRGGLGGMKSIHYYKVQKRDLKVLKHGRATQEAGRVQSRNTEEGNL